MVDSKRKVWDTWEIIALKYLQTNWYTIEDTNYQVKWWEIDIIAKDNGKLVFIEVKYRRWNMYWTPEEAMTKTKNKNLLYTIKMYCLKNKVSIDNVRVDFLWITPWEEWKAIVKHYKNISLY